MKAFILFLFLLHVAFAIQRLDTVYEWKYIDYQWESPEQKEEFIRNGDYDHRNIVPIDVDKATDGRVFITAIRNKGVPASLATVTDEVGPSGPLLKPYPDWTWHKRDDCNGITSVYRVAIDDCNQMYVLDNGYIGSNYTCPAQVLIFNLKNDQLVRIIKIPDSVSKNKEGVGKLVTIVVEQFGWYCDLSNLFMADVSGNALVIYNRYRESFFRLEEKMFEPEPFQSNVTIAGESFDLPDSLMGMSLLPLELYGDNYLFLRPFASKALYATNAYSLGHSNPGNETKYISNHQMLPSQASAMATILDRVLVFGLTQEMAIGCWNRRDPMTRDSIDFIAQDDERLQFISGLKVLSNKRAGGGERIWVFSNRLQKIMTGTINFDEINFRAMEGSTDELLRGTRCDID